MSESVALSGKQRVAVTALLSEPSVEAAALTAHVSPRTLHRWLRQSAFAAAVEHARQRQSEEALALLRSTLGSAVLKARDLLDSPSPAVSLRAADLLLEHAMRLRSEQALPLRDALKLQAIVMDLLLSTIRELHLDEHVIRTRISAKFTALREAGWPAIDLDTQPAPQPSGATNGHAD